MEFFVNVFIFLFFFSSDSFWLYILKYQISMDWKALPCSIVWGYPESRHQMFPRGKLRCILQESTGTFFSLEKQGSGWMT